MSAVYHILNNTPPIYKEDMIVIYEDLAQRLLKSGKMRVDTGDSCNFVQFSDSSATIFRMFSREEIYDENIINDTISTIKALYLEKDKQATPSKIESVLKKIKNNFKTVMQVDKNIMLMLSRLFVRSAHPIVIEWLLNEKVEVFITYGNNIGDVMNVMDWKKAGNNSGMQSTSRNHMSIYVSCGGDPFEENNKKYPQYGGGWAAVARLQIIAAQEIGHFADIKRDEQGRYVTRFSCDFGCTKPNKNVNDARLNDIKRCKSIFKLFTEKASFNELYKIEKDIKFFRGQNLFNLKSLILSIKLYIYRKKFLKFAERQKMFFIKKLDREEYIATSFKVMLDDMQAQLTQTADVYKGDTRDATDAINCAEALARVPQQVMKWGHLITQGTMYDLYKIYYGGVIPDLIRKYNIINNTKYKPNYNKVKLSKIEYVKNIFKKKNKIKLQEVREM